jgi:hypothetical protein
LLSSYRTATDVGGKNSCAEAFKKVSAAAETLTNERRRRDYDFQLQQNRANPLRDAMYRKNRSGFGNPASSTGRMSNMYHYQDMNNNNNTHRAFKSSLFRFRAYMFVGSAVLIGGWFGSQFAQTPEQYIEEQKGLVQAWKNPRTGRWETPAPWDPVYRQLQPELKLVARDKVERRHF